MNSKSILTVARLQVFMNEFWSIACPRAQQTTQNTPFSIASGRGHHKSERGINSLRRRLASGKLPYARTDNYNFSITRDMHSLVPRRSRGGAREKNAWYALFAHAFNLCTFYCVTQADDVY